MCQFAYRTEIDVGSFTPTTHLPQHGLPVATARRQRTVGVNHRLEVADALDAPLRRNEIEDCRVAELGATFHLHRTLAR